jgi:diguanylate cyclase (GGDEF)-like protein/PAS domain S-box-containing protein
MDVPLGERARAALAALAEEGLSPERLRREQEHAYFNDIYLLAPVGYFVLGLDTTILQMNLVGADLLGVPRLNPERVHFRNFVSPRFIADFDRLVQAAINSSEPQHCDLQLLRAHEKHGFPATLRASADLGGQALRVVLELAEGKLAALERSEERFRRIVHTAEEGIWEIDDQARTSFVNPKMAAMLGYTIEQMLEQPLVNFMDDEGRTILERNIARRRDGVAERHEFKFLRADGSALWATLATNPIFDPQGQYLGALALVTDITARRASSEQIWHQANFDALTALPNRHMFQDRLRQEIKKAKREGLFLALLFIDLDGFKQINDTLGHAQGDALLVEAARRIGACVRASDTLARLGGDEFTIILSGLDHVSSVERIARNILDNLNQPFRLGERRGRCRPAWASRCSRRTGPSRTSCCATPTRPCTRPSMPGATATAISRPTCSWRPRPACRSSRTCGWPSRRASSPCITSPSSTSLRASSSAPRRCCAGSIRNGACWPRPSSWPRPSRTVCCWSWATGCSARRPPRPASGSGSSAPVSRSA